MNGYRFHTHARELSRKTQNSGVTVNGEHDGKSIDFYGVVVDIIELEYLLGNNHVLLFKCDWWNTNGSRGIQIDKEWNIISVNISRKWYVDQPFILASQAAQVFYVEDLKLGHNWRIIEKINPRGFFDVPERDEDESINLEDPYQEEELDEELDVVEVDELPPLGRNDLAPLERIDAETVLRNDLGLRVDQGNKSFINDDDIDEHSESSEDDYDEALAFSDDDNIDKEGSTSDQDFDDD